jgi:predicted GNAT family acetyltransferase
MAWETTSDIDAFLAGAGEFLRAGRVEHTLLLTIAESLRARGANAYGDEAPRSGWWRSGGAVEGAFLHTPPHAAVLTSLPDAAVAALGDALADGSLPGLNGPEGIAQAAAEAIGAQASVWRRERLYRLETLTPPDPLPPGRAVVAGPAGRDRLIEWYGGYAADTNEPVAMDAAAVIDDRISHGRLVVWEAEDGAPASMAGLTGTVAGMVRINLVYTPPECRRQGLGAAVTAAASRAALDAGAEEVVLFTDRANPTTNHIYEEIGYRPVGDRVSLRFATPASTPTPDGR